MPAVTPSMAASGAMIRTSRDPTITRDRTSRPSRSVPIKCAGLGGRWLPKNWLYGSYGVIRSPRMAVMIQPKMIRLPMMNDGRRSSRRIVSRRACARSEAGSGDEPVARVRVRR